MADEGREEGLDGGDEIHNERERLVEPEPQTYLHFRQGREPQLASRYTGLILAVFKITFCSLGLWGHRAWNYVPRALFVIICAAQAANQVSTDIKCPYFDCSFYQKFNQTQLQEFLQTRETCFTLFSLAALLSYVIFLGCFIASRRKDSALVSPSLSMTEDVDRMEIVLLFLGFVVIVASFSSAIVLFFNCQSKMNLIQDKLIIATAILIFLAHWASVNTCHVFAISSLTLGKFNVFISF